MAELPGIHDGTARREWWAGWVLWPASYLATAAVLYLGVGGSSLPGWNLGMVMSGFMLGGGIAAGWGICFIAAALNARTRMSKPALARWLGIPALGLVCLALMLSGVPATVRFELSRSALDQAAARVEAGETVEPGWIGLIPIDSVEVDGTETYLWVAGSGGFGQCMLVHARDTARPDWGGAHDLGGNWWLACEDD